MFCLIAVVVVIVVVKSLRDKRHSSVVHKSSGYFWWSSSSTHRKEREQGEAANLIFAVVAVTKRRMSFRIKPHPQKAPPDNMVDDAATSPKDSKQTGLKPQIGLVGTISIMIGTMIGSGIFASPSVVIAQVGSAGGSLVIWAGCGTVAMLAALCWMELGCMFPNKGGGEHTYLGHAFGPLPAFLYAYVNVLVTRPASLCIISLTCGNYIMEAFDLQQEGGFQFSKLIAASLIGLLCWIFLWCMGSVFYYYLDQLTKTPRERLPGIKSFTSCSFLKGISSDR